MKLHLITMALAGLAFVSCGTTKTTDMDKTSSTNEISQNYWVLETLEGQQVNQRGDDDREIGFKLDPENNRISGYTGCNNFMGTYSLESGDRIRFSALGSTKMACPDSSINENDLLEIFEQADNYRITGDRLELNVGRRAPLAVFRKSTKQVASESDITEKYWKLKTLEGKEVKMGKNQEREVYFTLKNDGNKVTGFAGCNSLSGTYKLEKGNRIRFSHMATTMMACPEVDFKEHEFLKIFELADNYTITGDELRLNVGRRAPLAVFEAVYMD